MEYDDLPGRYVTLVPLQIALFEDYARMFSPVVRNLLHVPSVDHELDYLHLHHEKLVQGMTFFYCIIDNHAKRLIGALEIRNALEHPGQLYSWVNEQFWGGGRYREALALAANAYFEQTLSLFFTAHVDITNLRSYCALRKAGFAQAGFYKGPYGKQYILLLRNTDTTIASA